MSVWEVYADVDGNPLYATVELDGLRTEDQAFDEILDMFRSTLEVTQV